MNVELNVHTNKNEIEGHGEILEKKLKLIIFIFFGTLSVGITSHIHTIIYLIIGSILHDSYI